METEEYLEYFGLVGSKGADLLSARNKSKQEFLINQAIRHEGIAEEHEKLTTLAGYSKDLKHVQAHHARKATYHSGVAHALRDKAGTYGGPQENTPVSQESGHRMNQVSVDDVEQFIASHATLTHHGVKGMHWGIRRPRTPAERMAHIDRKIAKTNARIDEHKATIAGLKARQKDANENGVNSASFKREFGNHSTNLGFALQYGRSKSQALQDHKDDLQFELDNSQHALGFHQNRLQRQQARKAKIAARS